MFSHRVGHVLSLADRCFVSIFDIALSLDSGSGECAARGLRFPPSAVELGSALQQLAGQVSRSRWLSGVGPVLGGKPVGGAIRPSPATPRVSSARPFSWASWATTRSGLHTNWRIYSRGVFCIALGSAGAYCSIFLFGVAFGERGIFY